MAIQFAIYTCPPIASATSSPDPSSEDSGFWSPLSCTLIYTPVTAVIVDCPATIAATTELATWIKSTLPNGCTLKHFIISHAHGDHFLGIPVLQNTFPGITAIGTKTVVEGVAQQYSPQIYDGLWRQTFPTTEPGTGVPLTKADFVSLPSSNDLDLDGHALQLFDVPHGDTHANSFVHVPELGLVVAGDIVYNGDCHQWLGEASTQEKRNQWNQALSQIAVLKPKVIVPGHTFMPMSEPNEFLAASMLNSTKEYIKGFEEELGMAASEEDLFKRMKARYSRWNLSLLDGGCKAGILAKQS